MRPGPITFLSCLPWLAATTACTPGRDTARTVPHVMGVVVPLTGPQAAYGLSVKNGIDLALNSRAAPASLRVVYVDDQGIEDLAKTATQRLITQEKVALLIGEVSSSISAAMAPMAQRARVPMITPSATSPRVTEAGDYVFRLCFTDSFQAQAMARFAARDLHAKRIAVLRDLGSEYSMGLAEAFVAEIRLAGVEVAADEGYAADDAGFDEILTRVKASAPDAVYLPGYHREVARLTARARALGISAPFLGGDGWDTDALVSGSKDAIEGSYFTTHYSSDDPRPIARRFVEAYVSEYNETPDAMAALGYDTALFALDALERWKNARPEELRAAILGTTFDGVTGTVHFDAERNAKKPVTVLAVRGGRRVLSARVEPRP